MAPLIVTSVGLNSIGIFLAATTIGDTIGSVATLITAISGLILAAAAWRARKSNSDDDLTRRERAELKRLRREHDRRQKDPG